VHRDVPLVTLDYLSALTTKLAEAIIVFDSGNYYGQYIFVIDVTLDVSSMGNAALIANEDGL